MDFLDPQSQQSENEPKQQQIGHLFNIGISYTLGHEDRAESRKLVHLVREKSKIRMEELYLIEHEDKQTADLKNLAFIYANIRHRMEAEL